MEVTKVWFSNEEIHILLDDGRELWQSLLWYPRLMQATEGQRSDYKLQGGGIRWEALDEDMSLESFFYDNPAPEGIALLFRRFPELNVAAIAQRSGVKQSLLRAYISGTKTPSAEQEKQIENAIRTQTKIKY